MRSNSSTKLTANCNMTCKRIFIALAVLLFSLLALPVSAAKAADKLPGEADILLLHDEQVTDDQLENIRLLADTATALGKGMEIGTPAQASGLYSKYTLIICYSMDADDDLARTLINSGAKVLVLGGDILPSCLKTAAPNLTVRKVEKPGDNGVLRYSFSDEQNYESIVTLPAHIYATDTEYSNGTLETNDETYAFCMQSGGVRYIPLVDFTADLSRASLMREISVWLWDYSGLPPQKGQYIVLDEVYAYMPAQDLMDRVNVLVEANLPFVISVMPIYSNTDYPAMQQFCEVLRYAQANGGAIIVRTPILRTPITDWDDYNAVITDVLEAFTSYGVYPLGFDVPYSWTWDEDALEWMKRSRTIFVYEDSDTADFTRETQTNLLFYNYNALVLPALSLDDGGENAVLQYSASLRIPASVEVDELESMAENMQSDHSPYYSLWDNDQSVWADNFHISWKNDALTLNDEVCSLTYTPQEYQENYDYKRNILQRFTASIQNESHFLIILVAVVTILFTLMILHARRQQRMHFLYRADDAGSNTSNSPPSAQASAQAWTVPGGKQLPDEPAKQLARAAQSEQVTHFTRAVRSVQNIRISQTPQYTGSAPKAKPAAASTAAPVKNTGTPAAANTAKATGTSTRAADATVSKNAAHSSTSASSANSSAATARRSAQAETARPAANTTATSAAPTSSKASTAAANTAPAQDTDSYASYGRTDHLPKNTQKSRHAAPSKLSLWGKRGKH